MKNNLQFPLLLALFLSFQSNVIAQETGRRYTFIARDGSEIINVLLVQEKEDSYTVKIGRDNQELIIPKKNIEKLVTSDTAKKIDYKPVIGKKSGPIPAIGTKIIRDKPEDKGHAKKYRFNLGLNGNIFSTKGLEIVSNSQGWGVEILPTIGERKFDIFQFGTGVSYFKIDSLSQIEVSYQNMTYFFGYLQISHAPDFLSLNFLTIRPFIGIAFGGVLTYPYSKAAIVGEAAPEEGNKADNTYNFSLDRFYGLRGGTGIKFGEKIPIEFVLSFQYSVISNNNINNHLFLSAGVNFLFQ